MSYLGTLERPIRVAIVGSGPSGFYAADPLLKGTPYCSVDMFDRLPTPYGLVRGGVAPDHPKIRSVTRVYEKIAEHERFRFLGNVCVGKDVTVEELREHYDVILFACGAESDRKMNIPGENLPGSHTATSFVGWYNGHPDYRDLSFDLSQEVVHIIGVGNVAMDVARILAKTVNELKDTDIAQHALDALAESKVREIHIIGRRGPAQAKYTTPEIKEMGELEDCDPVVDPAELDINEASRTEAEVQGIKRNLEILKEFSERQPSPEKRRRMFFRFLLSPVEIKGNGRVESIVLERNRLEGPANNQRAIGTGELIEEPAGLVFRSIGYYGLPIAGVPYDERKGVFPNEEGRIMADGKPLPGFYCAGWIKRGPSGIIGTNKPDSLATVKMIWEDATSLIPCPNPSTDALIEKLRARGVRVVTFQDWRRIDTAEIERGGGSKPRERFTRILEMLHVLEPK